jgi:hypothetical protein
MGLSFGLKGAAHALHGCRRPSVHHRAFMARGIEGHIELLGQSGSH